MRIAINGLGRIGRAVLKNIVKLKKEIVAVNDLADIKNLLYLLKYDSVYGRWQEEVKIDKDSLIIAGKKIKILNGKDPSELPWKELGVDVVLEATGVFLDKESNQSHITAGAKYVIISAPAEDDTPTYVLGVNTQNSITDKIISNASCTTNCVAPILEILDRYFGIDKSLMSTIHAYTATQNMVDTADKRFSRGRAASLNLVPTTTGAAKAACLTLPNLKNKFDGLAIRVPIPVVSLIDLTAILKNKVSVEEINEVFKKEAQRDRYKDILGYTEEPLVSTDFIGDEHSAVVAGEFTRVCEGDMVKVMAWYENEWAYVKRLVELIDCLKLSDNS